MEKQTPQIIVAAFCNTHGAVQAAENLAKAAENNQMTNLALAKKHHDASISCKEYGKPGSLKGLMAGTEVGNVVGGLSLALGVAGGGTTGGVTGGAIGAAALSVESMDKDHSKAVGSTLEPGTSAMVAVFGQVFAEQSNEFKEISEEQKRETDKLIDKISADISTNLKNGQDVACLFDVGKDGALTTRMVVRDIPLILTPEAVKAAEVTSSKEENTSTTKDKDITVEKTIPAKEENVHKVLAEHHDEVLDTPEPVEPLEMSKVNTVNTAPSIPAL